MGEAIDFPSIGDIVIRKALVTSALRIISGKFKHPKGCGTCSLFYNALPVQRRRPPPKMEPSTPQII